MFWNIFSSRLLDNGALWHSFNMIYQARHTGNILAGSIIVFGLFTGSVEESFNVYSQCPNFFHCWKVILLHNKINDWIDFFVTTEMKVSHIKNV